MSDSDSVFSGSIADLYERYLVPLIFVPCANDLAARVAALDPTDVLETAAGTGVLTRALAARLAPGASHVVTDLNQPMLDQAAAKQGPGDRLTWRQANALDLPFGSKSFDAYACQFGVMFFPDRVAGFAEARRVLRPGGTLAFNVWDRIETNDFAHVVTQAAAEVFPEDPPAFLARTPHGYHDAAEIRQDVLDAGFADVNIDTFEETSTAPQPRDAAVAYCQGTPLRNEIEARNPNLLEHVTERATQALADRFGGGPISGAIRGHVITAIR